MSTDEDIIYKYVKLEKSARAIAREYGCSSGKIIRILERNDIVIRNKSEQQKASLKRGVVSHPTAGKHRSKDTKNKIGGSVSKKHNSKTKREKDEIRKKIRDAWYEQDEGKRRKIQKLGQLAVKESAQKGSKLELFLVKELHRRGYVVTHHYDKLFQNEKFHVDLFVHGKNICIEVDGPSHSEQIWSEDWFHKRVFKDKKKNLVVLNKYKFNMVRVINPRIYSNIKYQKTLETLVKVIDDCDVNDPKLTYINEDSIQNVKT